MYTATSGMLAQQYRLDAIANNLANVDTAGYKRDLSLQKAFPELLIRRLNDQVVRTPPPGWPLGSVDVAPVVGKLGTGVEQNEVFTVFEQGVVVQTDNPFDVALSGDGFLVVQTPDGERLTRAGSFQIGPEGLLVTQQGFPVLAEDGSAIPLTLNNFRIDEAGRVLANRAFLDQPGRPVQERENTWLETVEIARLRIVDVDQRRYLQKQGENLYRETPDSGAAGDLLGTARPTVLQGFIEKANVNPVTELVRMIEVQRSYEANQRVIQSHDEATGRLLSVVRR